MILSLGTEKSIEEGMVKTKLQDIRTHVFRSGPNIANFLEVQGGPQRVKFR